MIRRSLISVVRALGVALAVVLVVAPAEAMLKPGDIAPAFDTQASLGGHTYEFKLSDALAKGPVVLYFFPAAFTSGCTLEAHDFAEHMGAYEALGATVIGVSGDGIAKLKEFSVSECRSKFPVASDGDHKISKAYDATIGMGPLTYSNRTSYVIDKTGKIVYAYSSLDFSRHVANTMAALKKLEAQ